MSLGGDVFSGEKKGSPVPGSPSRTGQERSKLRAELGSPRFVSPCQAMEFVGVHQRWATPGSGLVLVEFHPRAEPASALGGVGRGANVDGLKVETTKLQLF